MSKGQIVLPDLSRQRRPRWSGVAVTWPVMGSFEEGADTRAGGERAGGVANRSPSSRWRGSRRSATNSPRIRYAHVGPLFEDFPLPTSSAALFGGAHYRSRQGPQHP